VERAPFLASPNINYFRGLFMYNNYKFYKSDNKIIAISSFAGKKVKGVAKCDPEDTFSVEFGEKLAAARCDKKVAFKRVKSANAKLLEAAAEFEAAQKKLKYMTDYYGDSLRRLKESEDSIKELLDSIEC
jgi:hypothetical protein